MKRILYLLLVSAPIFSMQQDTPKVNIENVRTYGKEVAVAATLGNLATSPITNAILPTSYCCMPYGTLAALGMVVGYEAFKYAQSRYSVTVDIKPIQKQQNDK